MHESVAGYPVRPLRLEFGETSLTMLVVGRPEDYVDTAALLRGESPPEPPYWIHLWAGSRSLARLVAEQRDWSGLRVLDLGCGLGLPGVLAAVRGASVTLIDAVHDALRFARANAAVNGCRVSAVQSDLHRPAVRGCFDVCLVGDATYDPALQLSVAAFLAEHLGPGGYAWCSESVRTTDGGFRHACEQRGLRAAEREVREIDEGQLTVVRITEVRRDEARDFRY